MDHAPRLSLALLGTFDIRLDGQPVTTFESVKVRALLAYLAVEGGRQHARTALAELLWPELPAATARTYLRHVLATLKEAIPDGQHDATPGSTAGQPAAPPFLHITRETVAFNWDSAAWLDVTAFTRLLEACARHPHRHPARCAACAQRRDAAIALYRGDFLTNLVLGDSAAFEEWAALKRERLRQQVLTALANLADYQEHCGAYAQAERLAWRQLELDPWREEAAAHAGALARRPPQRGAGTVPPLPTHPAGGAGRHARCRDHALVCAHSECSRWQTASSLHGPRAP